MSGEDSFKIEAWVCHETQCFEQGQAINELTFKQVQSIVVGQGNLW